MTAVLAKNEGGPVDDTFQIKVRAAATAAWWTLAAAATLVTVQWFAYLLIMSTKPAWVQPLWGPEATWESIRSVWFNALVLTKLSLWPLALVALWLTLWARQLSKRARRSEDLEKRQP